MLCCPRDKPHYERQLSRPCIHALIAPMGIVRKCPKCGFDLSNATSPICPGCGTPAFAIPRVGKWIGAGIQIALSTTFMLVFGFPKVMIVVFATLIVIGTAVSTLVKPRAAGAPVAPQRPVSNPLLFKILSVAIGLCSFVVACFLLFGFVSFMNSWERWHRYEGHPYQRTDFVVTRVYLQTHTRGGPDIYASGTVEGKKEWMSLRPYLNFVPHSQEELDSQVGAGTVIPVYFFPDLKGRTRVQVLSDPAPAEANRRTAMSTLNSYLVRVAVTAGIIFLLFLLRRSCYADTEASFQQASTGPGNLT
jgi:hypothetical protein